MTDRTVSDHSFTVGFISILCVKLDCDVIHSLATVSVKRDAVSPQIKGFHDHLAHSSPFPVFVACLSFVKCLCPAGDAGGECDVVR